MTTALAAVALVLGVARLAMFIALHLVPSDYNIVQHAVSDYAVGPTRRLADVEGQPTTLIGRLHLVAAIAWFAIAYSCMGNIVRLLAPLAPQGLVSFLGAARWVTAAALIALVTALVIRRLRPYAFGISERIFLLAVYVFYLGTAAGLLLA